MSDVSKEFGSIAFRCLTDRSKRQRDGSVAGSLGPVAADRVGNRQKRTPNVNRAIVDEKLSRHLRVCLSQLLIVIERPPLEPPSNWPKLIALDSFAPNPLAHGDMARLPDHDDGEPPVFDRVVEVAD